MIDIIDEHFTTYRFTNSHASGSGTTILLEGKSWGEKLPGMTELRTRKALDKFKREDFPKGFEWEGKMVNVDLGLLC